MKQSYFAFGWYATGIETELFSIDQQGDSIDQAEMGRG